MALRFVMAVGDRADTPIASRPPCVSRHANASHALVFKTRRECLDHTLMEDPIRDVAVTDNGFAFDLKPFEITSFKVQLNFAK